MEIKRAGSRPSGKGLAEWSAGAVRVDPLHGAAPTTAVSRVAVQARLDGKVVEGLEHASDEQYVG